MSSSSGSRSRAKSLCELFTANRWQAAAAAVKAKAAQDALANGDKAKSSGDEDNADDLPKR